MRKKTLASVCVFLLVAILFLLKFFSLPQGLWLPFLGFVSPVLVFFIALPLVLIVMGAINQRLLAWHKARGRDVELEEAHEFDDADIISLRQRQPHEHSSTYRGWEDDD
jgi:pilus assembly protein TadC